MQNGGDRAPKVHERPAVEAVRVSASVFRSEERGETASMSNAQLAGQYYAEFQDKKLGSCVEVSRARPDIAD